MASVTLNNFLSVSVDSIAFQHKADKDDTILLSKIHPTCLVRVTCWALLALTCIIAHQWKQTYVFLFTKHNTSLTIQSKQCNSYIVLLSLVFHFHNHILTL